MDSSQVRLEVAILAADQAASALQPTAGDQRRTVLVIGADDDARDRIRDGLGARSDLRIVVAPTVAQLLALAKVDTDIAKLLG